MIRSCFPPFPTRSKGAPLATLQVCADAQHAASHRQLPLIGLTTSIQRSNRDSRYHDRAYRGKIGADERSPGRRPQPSPPGRTPPFPRWCGYRPGWPDRVQYGAQPGYTDIYGTIKRGALSARRDREFGHGRAPCSGGLPGSTADRTHRRSTSSSPRLVSRCALGSRVKTQNSTLSAKYSTGRTAPCKTARMRASSSRGLKGLAR